MLLSKETVRNKISSGEITIGTDRHTPIAIGDLKFDTASLEVHLAEEFRVWQDFSAIGMDAAADPMNPNFDFQEYHKRISTEGSTDDSGRFRLGSRSFVLGITKEYIQLPNNIVGFIQGKSKLARIGLAIHLTAPTIQAGWGGKITLEIFNASPVPVILTPGMPIGQLIFHQIDQASSREDSVLNNQTSTGGG